MKLRLASLPSASLLCAIAMLSACTREEPPASERSAWIINSHVTFLAADAKTPMEGPKESLRLWFPYVVGDLYGAPNAGELTPVALNADLSFRVNLNLSSAKLAKALVPTEFSQAWMSIEPKSARVARLSAFVMPVDGIVPVGTTEWLDADTRERLMLVYFDRPATIRGDVVFEGRKLKFNIEAKEAGYLWIRQPVDSGEFHAVPLPHNVVLAVMPNT